MPDNLANQLIGRLLPEVWNFSHIKKLIQQCDEYSLPHNALGIKTLQITRIDSIYTDFVTYRQIYIRADISYSYGQTSIIDTCIQTIDKE